MEFQAIVMAAGRGNHMSNLTSTLPKPLLPVGNKPLIHYPINMLENAGFADVIVITLSSIKSAVELALQGFKIKVKVIGIDDDADLDTVDSLRLLKDVIKTDLFVVSCDLITDLALHRLADAHRLHKSTVTMLLTSSRSEPEVIPGRLKSKGEERPRELIGMSAVDDLCQRVVFMSNEADLEDSFPARIKVSRQFPRIRLRSDLHDAHMYIMKRWLLDYISYNTSRSSLRSELIPYIVDKQCRKKKHRSNGDVEKGLDTTNELETDKNLNDIYTFMEAENSKAFMSDIGLSIDINPPPSQQLSCYAVVYEDGLAINANDMSSYVQANRMVSQTDSSFCDNSLLIPVSVSIMEKSQVGKDCIVGERTTIGEKAVIKRSVIGRDCTIGSHVRIVNCILMDNVIVGIGCTVQGSVISQGAVIGEKCELVDCLIGYRQILPNSRKLSKESVVENAVMVEFE